MHVKEKELRSQTLALATKEREAGEREARVLKLEAGLAQTKDSLEAAQAQLGNNKEVIEWLNRELDDARLGKVGLGSRVGQQYASGHGDTLASASSASFSRAQGPASPAAYTPLRSAYAARAENSYYGSPADTSALRKFPSAGNSPAGPTDTANLSTSSGHSSGNNSLNFSAVVSSTDALLAKYARRNGPSSPVTTMTPIRQQQQRQQQQQQHSTSSLTRTPRDTEVTPARTSTSHTSTGGSPDTQGDTPPSRKLSSYFGAATAESKSDAAAGGAMPSVRFNLPAEA